MLTTALLSLATAAEPADLESRLLLAGQLAVTAEVFEQTGTTVSVNAFPVVVEWVATPRVGIRGSTLLNLQLTGPDTGFSHRGGGVAVPIYLSQGRNAPRHQQGWYVGPFVGLSTNPLVDGWDLTASAEGGIRWALGQRGHLNIAVQGGVSRLDRPGGASWVPHTGLYPSVGIWVF